MAIEDEKTLSLGAPTSACDGESLKFFRVVDKSLLASHTFLGDTSDMLSVDLIAQSFETLQVSKHDGKLTDAVIAPNDDAMFATRLVPPHCARCFFLLR